MFDILYQIHYIAVAEVRVIMNLSLITPNGVVFKGEVSMVIAKGVEGELGILPDHIPLMTPLEVGPLRVKVGDEERQFAVYGGTLQVSSDGVLILAESAEGPEDINLDGARREVDELRELLKKDLEEEEVPEVKRKLEVALTRVKVASKNEGWR